MSDKRSIIVNTVDQGGNKKQKSVTDINPNATGGQMYDFANALIGLTNSTLVNASVVDKTELGGTKQQLTLDVTKSSGGDGTTLSYATLKAQADYVEIEYKVGNTPLTQQQMKSVGTPYVKSCTSPIASEIYFNFNGTINAYCLFLTTDDELIADDTQYSPDANTIYNRDGSGEIVVVIPDTDTYYGGTVTITITA